MSKIVIAKKQVNIRRGPTTGSSIVGKLTPGQQLPALGEVIKGQGGETWVQVDCPNIRPAAAYVCLTLLNGSELAVLGESTGSDYNRGFVDGQRALAARIHDLLDDVKA